MRRVPKKLAPLFGARFNNTAPGPYAPFPRIRRPPPPIFSLLHTDPKFRIWRKYGLPNPKISTAPVCRDEFVKALFQEHPVYGERLLAMRLEMFERWQKECADSPNVVKSNGARM